MIYKGYKIEVEVSEYLTFALSEDGKIDKKTITSQDGWDVTGYYIQELANRDNEDWLTTSTGGRNIEQVKAHIDKITEEGEL